MLVPGVWLARLMYFIYNAGFKVECNELSYHLLLASACMFSHSLSSPQMNLYPWTLSFSNHLERGYQFQKVLIPDISIGMPVRFTTTLVPALMEDQRVSHNEMDHSHVGVHDENDHFRMTTGDFAQPYTTINSYETFDAVVTFFFIDTAPNFLRYIKAVYN